jgi:Zn-dependent protease with chaperone function
MRLLCDYHSLAIAFSQATVPRLLCAAAILSTLPAVAQDLMNAPTTAYVDVRPQLSGDVKFSIYTTGKPLRFGSAAAARQLPDCFWSAELRDDPERTSGTCRHLLARDGDLVNTSLNLGPLMQALRYGGAERVELTVTVDRWPGQEPEPIRAWKPSRQLTELLYSYSYGSFSGLPPPLPIRLENRAIPARPLIPFVTLLCVASALAFALRRRAKTGPRAPIPIWFAWFPFGCWLFWLLAAPPSRIVALVAAFHVQNLFARILASVVLFCIPPLLAGTIVFIALRRSGEPEGAPSLGVVRLLRRDLAPDAAYAVFASCVVIGLSLSAQDWHAPIVGIVAGIVAAGGIALLAIRGPLGDVITLEAGELRERAMEIASAAGVRLAKISILRNYDPQAANAFALRAYQHILITDRLLEKLTKREVDATVAHEVGHLRSRLQPFPPRFYWAYFSGYLAIRIVLGESPDFYRVEPLLAIATVPLFLLMALISRERELKADYRAALYWGDPAGMIASLARLAALSRLPLTWGWIPGLILSHPSMRSRVLSLAAPFGIPQARALAILDDPDILSRETGESPDLHYGFVPEYPHGDPVFSQSAITAYVLPRGWVFLGMMILLPFGLSYAVTGLLPGWDFARQAGVYLLASPLVLYLSLRLVWWRDHCFLRKMTRAVAARVPDAGAADLVGLVPGESVSAETFFAWDLGKFFASGDRIVYSGERAKFSVPRSVITAIELIRGPVNWKRWHAVRFRWQGGSFIVREPLRGTRRQASEFEQRWRAWWKSDADASQADERFIQFPLPELPVPQATSPSVAKRVVTTVVWYLFTLAASFVVSSLLPDSPLHGLAVFSAPILWLIAGLPGLIAPRSRDKAGALSH